MNDEGVKCVLKEERGGWPADRLVYHIIGGSVRADHRTAAAAVH